MNILMQTVYMCLGVPLCCVFPLPKKASTPETANGPGPRPYNMRYCLSLKYILWHIHISYYYFIGMDDDNKSYDSKWNEHE